MSEIQKGIVLTLSGSDKNGNANRVTVQSSVADGTSTDEIVIPWHLRGSMGMLQKQTEVVYAIFDDGSGILLARADGEWDGRTEEQITVAEVISNGISLSTHTHGGVTTGGDRTQQPN